MDDVEPTDDDEARAYVTRLVTQSFQELLSVGKGLWHYHKQTRKSEDYDYNVGYVLAGRYADSPPPLLQFIFTAAILRSHCGPEAFPKFIRTLKGKVDGFGIAVDDDGHAYIQPGLEKFSASIDLYGVAQDCAARGDMELDWGPFSGEAATLWDAGFLGTPLDDRAAEALAARATNVWEDAGILAAER